MSKTPSSDILSGEWAKLVYYTLGSLHDFAYFGYITVQPLIFNSVLARLTPFKEHSFEITVFIITTQLVWQVFLETPTGAYADNRGRMYAVRQHFLLRIVCMIVLVLAVFLSTSSRQAYVPWLVLGLLFLIEFGMAAAEALLSGSLEAWLVDTLTASGRRDEAGETFSKGATLFNVAILVAMPTFLFLQYVLKDKGSRYFVVGVAAVVFGIGAIVSQASLREVYRIGVEWESRSQATLQSTWRDGLQYLWQDRVLWWTTVLKASPFAAWVLISWFWPLLVRYPPPTRATSGALQTTGDRWMIGISIALAISRISGSGLSYILQKLTPALQGLLHWTAFTLGAALCMGFSLLFLPESLLETLLMGERSSYVILPTIVFALSFMVAKGSEEVVKVFNQIFLSNYVQNDTVRATVISFNEAVMNLIGFVLINLGLVITWSLPAEKKAPSLLIFASCAGILLAIIAYRMMRRSRVRMSTVERFDSVANDT